jgi:hypothetical protein
MKKIIDCLHVSTNDIDGFYKLFKTYLKQLQNDGQEVEVQYNTQIIPSNSENPILHSALLIGRKEI